MNKPSFMLFATILLFSCGQQKEEKISATSVVSKLIVVKEEEPRTEQNNAPQSQGYLTAKQQADSLILYYKKAQTGESKKYEKLFFEAFPSTFKGMQDIFGFDDAMGAAPLYAYPLGNDIIKHFTTLTTIPKDEYYQKYTSICVGGIWEADNIQNAFGFADKLLFDTKPACSSLEKHSDEEIKSVFRFIFDGPHPNNEENQKLYNKLLPKVTQQEKRLGRLLTATYSELMKEDDGHGH